MQKYPGFCRLRVAYTGILDMALERVGAVQESFQGFLFGYFSLEDATVLFPLSSPLVLWFLGARSLRLCSAFGNFVTYDLVRFLLLFLGW